MKLTAKQVANIKALHKKRLSQREIAKKTGHSRTTVRTYLNK